MRPIGEGHDNRSRLNALVSAIRPELFRYCSRLTGSSLNGEDAVQEAITKALANVGRLPDDADLRPWLFRIAHNCAIDIIRLAKNEAACLIEDAADIAQDSRFDAVEVLVLTESVSMAVTCFLQLPVSQRGAVILKDVIGHSLDEIAELFGLSVDSVKGLLGRGRSRLRALSGREEGAAMPRPMATEDATRFISLFKMRDWEGLRASLAEDVHLTQTGVGDRHGKSLVSRFFGNYAEMPPLDLRPALINAGAGPEVIAVHASPDDFTPLYLMRVVWRDKTIVRIQDFRYATYVLEGADLLPCLPFREPARQACEFIIPIG